MLIISYDLHFDRDYKPLIDFLESIGAERVLESLWVLNSDLRAIDFRDVLAMHVDSDDAIIVIRAPQLDWASYLALTPGTNVLAQVAPLVPQNSIPLSFRSRVRARRIGG